MNHFASLSPKKLGSCHHLLEVLRSHWSIGIPAPALAAHLVCWSASSDPLLATAQLGWALAAAPVQTALHSTAHPGNSMGAQLFQLVHWAEHLTAQKSFRGSYSSSKGVLFPKRLIVGITGKGTQYPETPQHQMCSVFQGMFGSVWKIGEYSQEAMDHWLSMTTPAMNSLQLLLCCLFWSCFTNASRTHIQVTNLHIRTWEGDGTSLWSWCWLRSLLWWWPTYSQLPFLWNLSAERRLNPALCFPKTPRNDLPLTIYIRHLCPKGI